MFLLYVDESGNTGTDYDNHEQPIFSMTGLIIESKKWAETNNLILKMKKEILPDDYDKELHATDIFNGKKDKKGRFDFRKNSLEKNLSILDQLVDMTVSINPEIINFIVRKEQLKKYCKSKYDNMIKIDPYLIAFPFITKFFDDYLTDRISNGIIFLDEQEMMVNSVDEILKNLRIIKNNEDVKIANIIENALFLNSFKSNIIQITDLCCFYINRYHAMHYGAKPAEIKCEHFTRNYNKLNNFIIKPKKEPFLFKEMIYFMNEYIHLFAEKK